MANKTHTVILVTSGKKKGTILARQTLAVYGNAKPQGSPIYRTSAKMNLHIDRGNRAKKTTFRLYN